MTKRIELIKFQCIATNFEVVVVLERRCLRFAVSQIHSSPYKFVCDDENPNISTTPSPNSAHRLYNTLLYVAIYIQHCKRISLLRKLLHPLKKLPQKYMYVQNLVHRY